MFNVKVLFFARLREQMGQAEFSVDCPTAVTLGQLRAQLGLQYPAFNTLRGPVMAAVNQDFAADETLLQQGDEVAFFPPVTGG
jgi:molybdopterin converting factor subunit 1